METSSDFFAGITIETVLLLRQYFPVRVQEYE
jgi:hypothetical protein